MSITSLDVAQIALVRPFVRLTYGTVATTSTDLRRGRGVHLSTDGVLIALGRQRIVSKGDLAPLRNARSRLVTAIAKHSIKMDALSGYAVPSAILGALRKEIDPIVADGQRLLHELINKWPDLVEQFALANPDWSEVIRSRAPTVSRLKDQLKFDYIPVILGKAEGFEDGLNRQVQEVLEELMAEAQKVCVELGASGFYGKESVPKAALDKLNRIGAKIESFSFLDSRLVGLSSLILETVKQARSKSGPVVGMERTTVHGLVVALTDPKAILGLMDQYDGMPSPFLAMFAPAGDLPLFQASTTREAQTATGAVAESTMVFADGIPEDPTADDLEGQDFSPLAAVLAGYGTSPMDEAVEDSP